jgi:hypothetical protein
MNMNERELDIVDYVDYMELLYAPETTDDSDDIEFNEDDADTEEDFIEGWLKEELLMTGRA